MLKKIIIGMCGASGSIYGIRLLEVLAGQPVQVSLIVSESGRAVTNHETEFDGAAPLPYLKKAGCKIHPDFNVTVYEPNDLFAPPASGSFRHDGMIIAPCSMRTLGTIAAGIAQTLLQRAADVSLKERRPLILVPRETPLSLIHLENMSRAVRAGAVMMPASPAFYNRPQTITALVDTVVARVLDHLGIPQSLIKPWGT